ncbi:MAG: contractile injection system tape measure protein [Segetibacter sp.]
MSDAAFHIIQKQRYDIVVAKEQQGVQLHKQLQDINFHCILPALGTKLDQLFPDDEVVVIDKLNIDIGHLSSHASAEEWIEKILAGLEISVNDLNSTTPAEHVVEINKLKKIPTCN